MLLLRINFSALIREEEDTQVVNKPESPYSLVYRMIHPESLRTDSDYVQSLDVDPQKTPVVLHCLIGIPLCGLHREIQSDERMD